MTRWTAVMLLIAGAMPGWSGIYLKDQQYRFCANGGCEAVQCSQVKAPACNAPPSSAAKLPVIEKGEGYKIAYLEYRENGDRWDNAEFEVAKKLIQDERKANGHPDEFYGGPITLFLYVHGWKNNADERTAADPGDVEKFRRYLDTYTKTFKSGLHRPVVGIYIAWHGKSLNLPTWINWISFWTRSGAALRVGKGELNGDFGKLVEFARESRETTGATPIAQQLQREQLQEQAAASDQPIDDPNRQTRAIVLSHSFGARVLQTALIGEDPAKGVTTGTCKGLVHGQSQRPPVDLILFENAATGAGAIWRQFNNCQPCGSKSEGCKDVKDSTLDFSRAIMMRAPAFDRSTCREHPEDARCQPYPLLVSVSAKNDFLTRIVLLLAAGEHPAPFLPWLQTHQVRRLDDANTIPDRAKGQIFTFESADSSNKKTLHTYLVERKVGRHVTPANAIWTMKVDKEIINQHGDVWNDSFLNFQINLISSTDRTKGQEHRSFSETLNRVTQPMTPPAN